MIKRRRDQAILLAVIFAIVAGLAIWRVLTHEDRSIGQPIAVLAPFSAQRSGFAAVAPTGPTGPCLEILHIGGKVIKGVVVWKWHGVAPTMYEDVCWYMGKLP